MNVVGCRMGSNSFFLNNNVIEYLVVLVAYKHKTDFTTAISLLFVQIMRNAFINLVHTTNKLQILNGC